MVAAKPAVPAAMEYASPTEREMAHTEQHDVRMRERLAERHAMSPQERNEGDRAGAEARQSWHADVAAPCDVGSLGQFARRASRTTRSAHTATAQQRRTHAKSTRNGGRERVAVKMLRVDDSGAFVLVPNA